jgi:hypothetical protein
MHTVEIRVSEADLAARLADMRAWLDGNRFEPSSFTYSHDHAALLIRVTFKIGGEAEAFARQFAGTWRSPGASSETGEGLPAASRRPAG